jgi:hypothetical protein
MDCLRTLIRLLNISFASLLHPSSSPVFYSRLLHPSSTPVFFFVPHLITLLVLPLLCSSPSSRPLHDRILHTWAVAFLSSTSTSTYPTPYPPKFVPPYSTPRFPHCPSPCPLPCPLHNLVALQSSALRPICSLYGCGCRPTLHNREDGLYEQYWYSTSVQSVEVDESLRCVGLDSIRGSFSRAVCNLDRCTVHVQSRRERLPCTARLALRDGDGDGDGDRDGDEPEI